ncbi:MAG: ribonuclease III domain-containing protein [Lachnospiraceae bacterium]|nr:ribonuclease III domain-containing protein [Lachnospiraceae bacterium]
MEKSIDLTFSGNLKETFGLPEKDWKLYSPLTLAYLGDAAYEVIIRTIFVKRANCQPQKLHQKVTSLVSAKTQARMIQGLLPELTEEEAAIYRRGHNSKPYTKAKNASMQEYLEATGFEAVIGYLYLQEDFARMNELVRRGLELLDVG